MTRRLQSIAALLAICLLPSSAWSVQLFEGNLGYDGDWLHVIDSSAMSDRVYWYDLGTDVTYRFQLAHDETYLGIVLDVEGIESNYVEPDVGPGIYSFRVSAMDATGAVVSRSDTGTLEVVADKASPSARIASPTGGQTFQKGETIEIELEVSDDTVLNLARFTIGGEYAGVLGLRTENYKVSPSFGESRIVTFQYPIPTKGPGGSLEISVDVTDVVNRKVTKTITVEVTKHGSTTESSTKTRGPKSPKK
jgi:hypothetical protein